MYEIDLNCIIYVEDFFLVILDQMYRTKCICTTDSIKSDNLSDEN
jgi:hypothetical protein